MALTEHEIDVLMMKDSEFRRLVRIYGRPRKVGDCGDEGTKAGDICMEGGCVDGKKLVMWCDESNGCTGHAEIPC